MLAKRTIIILLFLLWTQNALAAVNDNLELVLDFEDADRGLDTSGNGLNFSTNGTLPTVAGKIGSTAIIPDCTNFLSLADGSSGPLKVTNGSFSVSYWINTGEYVGAGHAVLSQRTGTSAGWMATIVGSGVVRMSIDDGSFSDVASSGGATNIENSGWHHVVSVSDQSVPEIRHYVDGALDGQGAASLRNISNVYDVRVGCLASGVFPLSETVDQIAFWSRALTLTDAQTIYNSGTGITLPETASGPSFIPGRSIIIIGLEWFAERFFGA